ncbi:MAG: TadE/TadG family type IV pilus assembly protein [Blastocatellia bacterium]|nr:TadE/TadG family type IV pilus assembly protein [Blastocatellia bacterium]
MTRRRQTPRAARGIQMVELAICMPILLLLFAVTSELGRLYFMNTTLAKGTRLAARYLTTAPLNTNDNAALHYANAKNLVVYGKIAPAGTDPPIVAWLSVSNVAITTQGGTASLPQFVTVQVTGMVFTPMLNLGDMLENPNFSLSVPLSPSTTMRYLITQPLN